MKSKILFAGVSSMFLLACSDSSNNKENMVLASSADSLQKIKISLSEASIKNLKKNFEEVSLAVGTQTDPNHSKRFNEAKLELASLQQKFNDLQEEIKQHRTQKSEVAASEKAKLENEISSLNKKMNQISDEIKVLNVQKHNLRDSILEDKIKDRELYINLLNNSIQIHSDELTELNKRLASMGFWSRAIEGVKEFTSSASIVASIEEKNKKIRNQKFEREKTKTILDTLLSSEKLKSSDSKRIEDAIILKNEILSNLKMQKNNIEQNLKTFDVNSMPVLTDKENSANVMKEKILSIQNEIATLKQSLESQDIGTGLKARYEAKLMQIILNMESGKNPISSKDLADLVIMHNYIHAKDNSDQNVTGKSLQEWQTSFAELSKATIKVDKVFNLKNNVDNEIITNYNSGQDLMYNAAKANVIHPLSSGQVQCYSGTNLWLSINELREKSFDNTLVILEKNHVLPAYIELKDNKLYLVGIETTAAGKALVEYGETKDIGGDIIVMDAKQFMLVEIFKHYSISNSKQIFKDAMMYMKKMYKFNPNNFKALDEENSQVLGANKNPTLALNSALFGFGDNSESKDEPRSRDKFEVKKQTKFDLAYKAKQKAKSKKQDKLVDSKKYESLKHYDDCYELIQNHSFIISSKNAKQVCSYKSLMNQKFINTTIGNFSNMLANTVSVKVDSSKMTKLYSGNMDTLNACEISKRNGLRFSMLSDTKNKNNYEFITMVFADVRAIKSQKFLDIFNGRTALYADLSGFFNDDNSVPMLCNVSGVKDKQMLKLVSYGEQKEYYDLSANEFKVYCTEYLREEKSLNAVPREFKATFNCALAETTYN